MSVERTADMLQGECFCGAIAYQIEGDLIEPRCCHCSRCRKAFSGAGSAYAQVTPDDFRWQRGANELTTFASESGFGLGFCRHCGSTLCGFYNGAVHGVTLGTLDDDPPLVIEKHIFVGSKAIWDVIGGHAPQHETTLDDS